MAKQLALPEVFFDLSRQSYWLRVNGEVDRYLPLDKRDVAIHLRHAGLEPEEKMGPLTALEKFFMVCQSERCVDYAGPLAGHNMGLMSLASGERILITGNPKVIEGDNKKSAPHFDKFLGQLLGDQAPRYIAWLKCARKALTTCSYQPGQALVFAGPAGCGKSFAQHLTTALLGGRHALPYRYMTGKTNFNRDLAGAEHWMIEDQSPSLDFRSRRSFGDQLKEATVNKFVSVHGKNKEALPLPIFRRVTISVNDETENLQMLPPLVDSLVDKIILLKCDRAKLNPNFTENRQTFERELPAFAAFVDSFRIPKAWIDERYGVVAYHHPELLEVLRDTAPEVRLLNLIDEVIFGKRKESEGPWLGSAEELERQLLNSPFSPQVDKLLSFSSACGTYLARIATQRRERVEARKSNGKTKWVIRAP